MSRSEGGACAQRGRQGPGVTQVSKDTQLITLEAVTDLMPVIKLIQLIYIRKK